MKSLWNETVKLPHFEALQGDTKCDVLIIGGGIAGLLCGYLLTRAGIDCCIAESGRICSGVTQYTTAKITSQHGLIYDKLSKSMGTENAALYLRAHEDAISEYRRLCADIDCDFETKDAYVYSLNSTEKIENEIKALERIGFKAELEKDLPLPFKTVGAVKFSNQAQFNPLKFISAIVKDLKIYEQTRVVEIIDGAARTTRGNIRAKKIIVATHFPIFNLHGSYFLKMYQERSYVLALKDAPSLDGMYIDGQKGGFSFRNYKDTLLIGGGSHRTGTKSDGWDTLQKLAYNSYSKALVSARWATQDCITLDGMAYIGNYSARTPNLYVATGFNKWGMTSAMVSAKLLLDLITEKDNPYKTLFSPSRSILKPQLFLNAVHTVTNIITPTVPRCPHLGCALKYNRAEHSWDCPCHGSRFSDDGKLLDGPATKDKK